MTKALRKNEMDDTSDRTLRAIERIHANRFTTLKKAMSYSLSKDYQKAIEEYHNFFQILAAFYDCREGDIAPSFFSKDKDITEIFLLSQVYWDLAKIYDKDPKFLGKVRKFLQKFVNFSQGFKFQFANSQMIYRYINSGNCRNREEFIKAYEVLDKNSGKCFVATYCYGENHFITNDLRLFKQHLLKFNLGKESVRLYYKYSPKLLNFCRKYPFLGIPLKFFIFYPLLFLTYLFWDNKFFRWPF